MADLITRSDEKMRNDRKKVKHIFDWFQADSGAWNA